MTAQKGSFFRRRSKIRRPGWQRNPGDDEARRYYIGIVGKYGVQVQNLLKVAAALDIQTICPLHGPVLTEDLGHYISLYDTWSSYYTGG